MSIPVAGADRARSSARSAARSTASSSRTSGCRRSPSRSARSRSTAASPSGCSAPRRSPTSPSAGRDLANEHDRRQPAIPVIVIPFVVLASRSRCCCTSRRSVAASTTIGLNTEAAHFTGVNVERTKFILFVLSGVVSAFAGIYYTLRFGSARGDNAHRPRAPGDRGRAARRRVDLRRPRRAARRHRRRRC